VAGKERRPVTTDRAHGAARIPVTPWRLCRTIAAELLTISPLSIEDTTASG
jgi:hypothetical protein